MAIREVLLSFTFEQQRQLINLIGVDVGDVSTLLTPTNEVVSGINEIVNGDVDLINQTHGMDDGTQASPSLYWAAGQGFYKVSGTKLGLTTSLAVEGDLEVDGDITFRAGAGSGGTLTFGDLDTDNIVLNADVNSNIIPDSDQSWNIGTSSKQWNDLYITGTAYIDTLQIDENATMTGHLTMESGDIRVPSTQTTVSLFDSYATTVNAFGAATTLNFGPTGVNAATLNLRFSSIFSGRSTLALFNQNVETLNAFGAATTINMGVAGSLGVNTNFNVASDDFVLAGDLSVNGGEILSSQNTVDLFITQGDVRIGALAGTGTTTIQNTLKISGGIDITNSDTEFLLKDNEAGALSIKEGTNEYVRFTTTNAGERILIYKDLYVVGNLDVSGSTTTIDVTTLTIEDKNIELGASSAPSDATADGGGITLKGTTDKTITYSNTTGVWESNIGLAVKGSSTPTGLFSGISKYGSLLIATSSETITDARAYIDSGNGNLNTIGTVRVDHSGNAGSDQLVRLGNVNNSGTNSAHLFLANGYYVSPTAVDGTGAAAKILADGTIHDSMGPLRRLAVDNVTGVSGNLAASDAGKLLRVSSSNITLTVPSGTYGPGDMITFFNESATNLTIAQGSSTTIYNSADGTTGNRTLAAKGMATLVCTASNEFVISGTQLT